MSQCDDAFQRLQALQAKRAALQAHLLELEKLTGIAEQAPEAVLGPDGPLRQAADEFIARLDGEEMSAWVSHAMETEARTKIASGGAQPNNVAQMLKRYDLQTVEDYARLSKALLDTGSELNPNAWRFVGQTYGKEEVARIVMESYGQLVGAEKLGNLLATDVAPFMNLVERMTRLRVAAQGFRIGLMEDIDALKAHRNSTAAPVPAELKSKFYQSLKAAMVSERHVDLARSRTGQTLRSLRDDLPDLEALKRDLEYGGVFDPNDPSIKSELGMEPGDTQQGSVFAAVVEALDDTDAARGAEKLEQIKLAIQLDGANPKSRLRSNDWFNLQMKTGNLLAKDNQLANFRTQLKTNFLSNAAMMMYGPYRQMWENYFLQLPAGTKFSRLAFENAYKAAWAGVRQGYEVIRSSGLEVFRDAAFQGKAVFAGNKDTYGRNLHANDQLVVRYQSLLDMPFEGGGPANPINWGLARNKIHAAHKLWLYEKTGQGSLLEVGLRMLGAQDNVAGLYHHAFKVRNDLELRARRDGAQLGLLDNKSVEDWIDTEFQKAFYSIEPTEGDVKAYRRELGLGSDISDDDIKLEILNKRIGETYSAPTLATPESIAAEGYSREMRFQNEPGDFRPDSRRSHFAKGMYKHIQGMRSNWMVDFTFPYLQSLLMGQFLDMNNAMVTPAIDALSMHFHPEGWTPAQRARVQANWVVAGTIAASYAALDMIPDMIIGNGPIEPKENQEWRMRLEARGLKPNSIAGIDLPGGIPVLNTLMLMKDAAENIKASTISNFDQMQVLTAGLTVLTGQVMRQTSLGQLRELISIAQDPYKANVQQSVQRLIGYMGSGQLPYIGLVRDAQYATGIEYRNYYQEGAPTPEQQRAGHGDDVFGRAERLLKSWARGTLGLTNAIGGVRKEEDWLGTPINLPFGMRYVEAMKHRFFPQLWPNDKVYAELDKQNMLNPPRPLMNGELDGVALTDDLQKEFQQAYSHTPGESMVGRFEISGIRPTLSVRMPYRIDLPSGATYERSTKMISIEVAPFLEEHVKGKKVMDALRSVINSPLYQALEKLPGTSADYAVQDRLPGERRGMPGQILLSTVKRYYTLVAHDAIVRSQSPDADEFRKARAAVFQQRQQAESDKLQDLVKAVNLPDHVAW